MKEIIVRISSVNDYVELAYKENENETIFKKMDSDKYVELINNTLKKDTNHHVKKLKLLDQQIIAIDEHYVVVKQSQSRKIVTYSSGDKIETYKINFPNAIYIVQIQNEKISQIECYSYKKYLAEETELFEYPMPNELTQNLMCIGTADRTIKDGNVIEALERIIFTPYSHSTFSGMNGFSNTVKYFEYLEKNKFPYKFMKPLRKKLKDVLEG